MTYLVMGVVMIVTAILQVQFPSYAAFGAAKVPFLFSVVIYYSLSHETETMLVSAFCAGFIQDSLSVVPLGYSALIFCVLGWVLARFRRLVISESIITPVFFGAVANMLFTIVMYIWLACDGLVSFGAGRTFMRIIGSGFLGALSAPVVFMLARSLDQLVGNIELKEDIDVFE